MCLAKSRDVVVFSLHRHQTDGADRRQVDSLVAVGHRTLRQRMLDEHGVDRLKVIFFGQIHDSEVLIVEFPLSLTRIPVTADEVLEHVEMSINVPIDIHRHEARKLQEARIDFPAEARIRIGHRKDAVVRKPLAPPLLCELVHGSR